jgi:hypothetical protein
MTPFICWPVILTCLSPSGHPQAGILSFTILSAAIAGWIAARMKAELNTKPRINNVFRFIVILPVVIK